MSEKLEFAKILMELLVAIMTVLILLTKFRKEKKLDEMVSSISEMQDFSVVS